MLRLESELPDEFGFESGLVTAETVQILEKKRECQMYSRVIQVFALLAVEAFLSMPMATSDSGRKGLNESPIGSPFRLN